MFAIISTSTGNNATENGDRKMNTLENRIVILDRIEKDGVNLKEFNKSQQVELIKTYAAVCMVEGLINA